MTTEGSDLSRSRFTDEPTRPRAKVCKVCCDLPDRRPVPKCPGCGHASTAKVDEPHAHPEPVWYEPPKPAPVVVVETTVSPPRRIAAPLPGPRKVILPARYIEAAESVAAAYGLTLEDLRAPNRTASLVRVRREAMRAVRALGASYPETGAVFCRDHGTVMNALRVLKRWRVAV